MWQRALSGSGGGGGGGYADVVSTTPSQEVTIDTKLGSALKCFTAVAYDSTKAARILSLVWTSDNPNKYDMTIGGLTQGEQTVGTAISGTYAIQSSMIKNVSADGKVTIVAASHVNYGTAEWYCQAQ